VCKWSKWCKEDEEAKKEQERREADISAIANQESLSILEVEMRKLEAVTKEIVDELGYLQRREMRMRDTNGVSLSYPLLPSRLPPLACQD
jgi:predicted nuclease with TOPRIM domain